MNVISLSLYTNHSILLYLTLYYFILLYILLSTTLYYSISLYILLYTTHHVYSLDHPLFHGYLQHGVHLLESVLMPQNMSDLQVKYQRNLKSYKSLEDGILVTHHPQPQHQT